MTSEQYDLLSHIALGAWTKQLYFRASGNHPPIPLFYVIVTPEEADHYRRVLGGNALPLGTHGLQWFPLDSEWVEYFKAILPMVRDTGKWIFAIKALEAAKRGGNAVAASILEQEFKARGIPYAA